MKSEVLLWCLSLVSCTKGEEKMRKRKEKSQREFIRPRITKEPTDKIAKWDETIRLNCEAKGIPKPDYYWYKDGEKIFENSNRSPMVGLENALNFQGSLLLQKVAWKDRTRDADWAGTYHCEVKNLVGGAVSRNVTVSSAYIRKNFLRDPSEDNERLEVNEGEDLNLKCSPPKGYPIPNIRWERDSQPILESGRVKFHSEGLRIINLKPKDRGIYTCIAENAAGSIESDQVDVDVMIPPTIDDLPRFISLDNTISIVCSANGNPKPKVRWMLGTEMKSSVSLGSAKLTTTKEGTFTCFADSATGTASETVFVVSEEKQSKRLPPILMKSEVEIEPQTKSRISCEPSNNDQFTRYRWYLNGEWIEGKSDLSSKMEISISEGQWLECRCVNSRGSSTLLVRTRESSAGSGASDSTDFEVDFEDGSSPLVDDEEVNLDLKITVEEDNILIDWAIDSSRDFMNLNYFLLDGSTEGWISVNGSVPINLPETIRFNSDVAFFARDDSEGAPGNVIQLPRRVIEINQQLGQITSAVIQDNKMELIWNDKLCDPSGATLTIQVHASNFQNGGIHVSCSIGRYTVDLGDVKAGKVTMNQSFQKRTGSENFRNEIIFNPNITCIIPRVIVFTQVDNHLQWELDGFNDDDAECRISGFKLGLFNSESDKVSHLMISRGELVNESKLSKDDRQFIYSTESEQSLVAVLQPLLTTKNGFNIQYEPSEIVTEYSPRMRNFILGLEFGFSKSNIILIIALALLLVVTVSLVTIRCRKWKRAHSKGNTSQWPITDEIFSKVERITNTDSDPSTSSLPPYNAIPFDTLTVQAAHSAQAQKNMNYYECVPPTYTHTQHYVRESAVANPSFKTMQTKKRLSPVSTFMDNPPLSPLKYHQYSSCPIITERLLDNDCYPLPPPPPTPPLTNSDLSLNEHKPEQMRILKPKMGLSASMGKPS